MFLIIDIFEVINSSSFQIVSHRHLNIYLLNSGFSEISPWQGISWFSKQLKRKNLKTINPLLLFPQISTLHDVFLIFSSQNSPPTSLSSLSSKWNRITWYILLFVITLGYQFPLPTLQSFVDGNPCGKAQDYQQLPALQESVGVLSRLFPIACPLET